MGDTLPTEFRIFKAGWNDSTKGRVLFDEEAAAAVMATYAEHGVDLMIDLEHLSLDGESQNFDPDARGWCRLEVRAGELWAVDVKWTTDGAERLSQKRQRYVSPAFWTDPETKRVIEISNVAITGMPATHHAMPLIAASKRGRVPGRLSMADGLTIEKLPALAEALGMAADAPLEDVMAALRGIVMAGDGQPQPTAETPPEGEALAEEAPPVDEEEDEKAAEAMAATARLLRLTGRSTLSASLDDVSAWKASHVKIEAEEKRLAAERAALELSERKRIAAELVAFGGELPSTVWADPTLAPEKLKLSRRLLDEPIGELRARHAAWAAAKGKAPSAPRTPAGPPAAGGDAGAKTFTTPRGVVTLSARELRVCEETGAKPEVYAANKATQLAARGSAA